MGDTKIKGNLYLGKAIDLTGQKFNRLLVLRREYPKRKNRAAYWLCRCDCGNEKVVQGNLLRRGNTQSCGCFKVEMSVKKNTKHGAISTRPYRIWQNMSDRCRNPRNKDYKSYAGRGIFVCERWSDFANFLADMGQPPAGHTLERRDNNKGYNPDNCYWATPKQQANNRRTNKNITYQGRTQTLSQWASEFGINYQTARYRMRIGFCMEQILSNNDRRYKDKPLSKR